MYKCIEDLDKIDMKDARANIHKVQVINTLCEGLTAWNNVFRKTTPTNVISYQTPHQNIKLQTETEFAKESLMKR